MLFSSTVGVCPVCYSWVAGGPEDAAEPFTRVGLLIEAFVRKGMFVQADFKSLQRQAVVHFCHPYLLKPDPMPRLQELG